jgi:hypothetical protein
MIIYYHKYLNFCRKTYLKIVEPNYNNFDKPKLSTNIEYGNKLIKEAILSNDACLIGRLGTTECSTVLNYLGVKKAIKNPISYITGKSHAWWWTWSSKNGMSLFSGFYPTSDSNLKKYCELVLSDLKESDILINLIYSEEYLKPYFANAKRITLPSAEPYFSINPWTKALKGKKVLVIHPMEETIKMQYKLREKIWPDGLLPEFELLTIKAVQTIAGEESHFNDWFDALDWMISEINKLDFDIAIIGCGAYGFHLAAHIKRIGKKAIHLGGTTQLLFGIKGRRWEDDPYQPFTNMMNDYWVRPSENEKPINASIVEGACYW